MMRHQPGALGPGERLWAVVSVTALSAGVARAFGTDAGRGEARDSSGRPGSTVERSPVASAHTEGRTAA